MSKITAILVEQEQHGSLRLKISTDEASLIDVLGEASNGQQTLQMIEEMQPDVVISEMSLPDMDAIELSRYVKTAPSTYRPKIVIVTNEREEKLILDVFAAGADAYLLKDLHRPLLLQAIQETLEDNAWIDPGIAKIFLNRVSLLAGYNHTPKIPLTITKHLTDREKEVLKLIVNGCNNALISEKLFITVGTVKTHVRSILNKLSVEDRTQAAVTALRTGLVEY